MIVAYAVPYCLTKPLLQLLPRLEAPLFLPPTIRAPVLYLLRRTFKNNSGADTNQLLCNSYYAITSRMDVNVHAIGKGKLVVASTG